MIKTPLSVWNKNNLKTGMTDSERILACLARKTFLNFWGYSNPYTDKSRGREICDFMVIFGNDIILFSDKACEFPEIDNLETAWCRWHKSAIKKSVRQLSGASSFIKKFPDRIFMDPGCNHPLPVPLPSPDKLKIHLVAVTRGSSDASKRDWGNESSSSLFTMFINAPIEEDKEDKIRKQPFMVTWPFKNLKNREFVHVLDELTLEILLNELDTASDFISYLTKKETYLTTNGVNFMILGEEELLESYFAHPLGDYEGFSFPPVLPTDKIAFFDEGLWKKFSISNTYFSRKKSNEISYHWDRLIERQTSYIYEGNTEGNTAVVNKYDPTLQDIQVFEFALRGMAEEGRSTRRVLAEQHLLILNRDCQENHLVKTIVLPNRAYILLVLKWDLKQDYEEYREQRKELLFSHCLACRYKVNGIDEVIGIASQQSNSSDPSTDLIRLQFTDTIEHEENEKLISALQAAGVLKKDWTSI